MLRAPVLMRDIRDRGSQRDLSRRPSLASQKSSRNSKGSGLNDDFAFKGSHISLYGMAKKTASSTFGAPLNLKDEFRVRISDVSTGKDSSVFFKDDEDRFSQR